MTAFNLTAIENCCYLRTAMKKNILVRFLVSVNLCLPFIATLTADQKTEFHVPTIDEFKSETQVCRIIHESKPERRPKYMDFNEFLVRSNVWVDKSLLAKRLLEIDTNIVIITCPRKWGKSLNLNMIKHIFQMPVNKKYNETSFGFAYNFFTRNEIWKNGVKKAEMDKGPLIAKDADFLMNHFQKYPVVYLDFKAFTLNNWHILFQNMIRDLYFEHSYLITYWRNIINNPEKSDEDKENAQDQLNAFREVRNSTITESIPYLMQNRIRDLCRWLFECRGKEVIVLIDEFDSLQNNIIFYSVSKNYSAEVKVAMEFMEGFVEITFKEPAESNIRLVVMTGITGMAKTTFLSGLNNIANNLDLNIVNMSSLTPFYGFMPHEVSSLIEHNCDNDIAKLQIKDAVKWYDGYGSLYFTDGSTYSPWSIMRYSETKLFSSYWEQSGSSRIISTLLEYDAFYKMLHNVVKNGTKYSIPIGTLYRVEEKFLESVHDVMVLSKPTLINRFEKLFDKPVKDAFMAILCQAGYLTVPKLRGGEIVNSIRNANNTDEIDENERIVLLHIPNFEIGSALNKLVNAASWDLNQEMSNAKYGEHHNEYVETFKQWFEDEVPSNLDFDNLPENMVEKFETLRSHLTELFYLTNPFIKLGVEDFRQMPADKICGIQHLCEAAVRRITIPMLEEFRRKYKPAVLDEFADSRGLSDTIMIHGKKILVIEYKSDSEFKINQLLEQAKKYTPHVITDAREHDCDSVKYLAINVFMSKTNSIQVDVAHFASTWDEAVAYALKITNNTYKRRDAKENVPGM